MKKLLIFKGGGYDGCIWEWNALVFENGQLADKQLVSGRYGEQALAAVQELSVFRGVREVIREEFNSRQENTDPFLIRTNVRWETFCKEWNAGFVLTTAKAADR